jgi:Mg2+ and Co2+ transporter CorA
MTEQSDLFRENKSNNGNTDWELHWRSSDYLTQILAIIADHIDRFGQPQMNSEFPSTLDLFEIGVVRILSDVDTYMNSATLATLNIKKERDFLHEIADIRSELAMIQDVFDQQDEVLVNLGKLLGDDLPKREMEAFSASKERIAKYRQRAQKIDKDAERIEKVIQDQLNLRRTYASMRDTRASVVLGTAVIGFTLITIIFSPLAFMTSLFALPLDNFLKSQIKIGDENAYPSGYIGKWFSKDLTQIWNDDKC